MNTVEHVILVTPNDEVVGTMEKMEAHEKGLLHRAFSVFVFNDRGEMLIHRRAASKYHSPGLWTNACCSHPRMGETVHEAAHRRLMEEMGFDCELLPMFRFIYRAELEGGLIEHELDHVLMGRFNHAPLPNADEVGDWKYMDMKSLEEHMRLYPQAYTVWFRMALPKLIDVIHDQHAHKELIYIHR